MTTSIPLLTEKTAASAAALPLPTLPANPLFSMSGLLIGMIVVLGLVLWGIRRFAPGRLKSSLAPQAKILAQHSLGGKERLVFVSIQQQTWVLGVTPSQITLLDTLPPQEQEEDTAPAAKKVPLTFQTMLKKTLKLNSQKNATHD